MNIAVMQCGATFVLKGASRFRVNSSIRQSNGLLTRRFRVRVSDDSPLLKEIRWLKNGLNGNVVVSGSRTTRVITTHVVTHAVAEQSTTSTVVWNVSTELLPDVRGQARNLKKLASTRSHGIPMGRPTVPARDLNFGRRVST